MLLVFVMAAKTSLAPWLSVRDATRALAYYKSAFGAVERYRLDDDSGRPVVAQLAIGDADFWIQEDADISTSPGGGSIRMILTVDDPDAVFRRALDAGATAIADVHDEHGWRTGRLADPFGHHWEVARPLPNAG
jgi:PhnB protein